MTLDLSVYDREFNLIGYIESYSSLLWTRNYYSPGSFKIECPLIEQNVRQLQLGNIIRKKDVRNDGTKEDSNEAGVIEYVYRSDSKDAKYMVAEGRFLSSYLDRRIVKYTTTHKGTSEEVMRAFIGDVVPIPGLVLGDVAGFTDTMSKQATWKNLLSIETAIAEASGHGFRVRPDFASRRMIFEVYDGLDRSTSQHYRNQVIFSDDYANLSQATHERSDIYYKTALYVGGQGEGSARKVYEYKEVGAEGLDLRETFVDAKDIMLEEGMTDAEYQELLHARAVEKQAECIVSDSVECTVLPTVNFSYKKDYDLGDVVTIMKPEWGIKADLRLTSIMEQYIGSTFSVFPTFGNPLPRTKGGDANEW